MSDRVLPLYAERFYLHMDETGMATLRFGLTDKAGEIVPHTMIAMMRSNMVDLAQVILRVALETERKPALNIVESSGETRDG